MLNWKLAEQPLRVGLEQESDGRWLAEVVELPGVLAYERTLDEALAGAEALVLPLIADRCRTRGTSARAEQPVHSRLS